MPNSMVVLYLLIGLIAGAFVTYLVLRSAWVKRSVLDTSIQELSSRESELSAQTALLEELRTNLRKSEESWKQENQHNQEQEKKLGQLGAELSALSSRFAELQEESKQKEEKLQVQMDDGLRLKEMLATLKAESSSLEEKLEDQQRLAEEYKEKSMLEFEQLANKIFEEKSKKFTDHNKEKIEQILSPLKENLKDFKKKVEETHIEDTKQRSGLEQRIKELVSLNEQIRTDASNLTNALKGQAKTQGDWGEMILESILEHSGLAKGREYETQESFVDEDGKRKQPDVTIRYPGDRVIIIDSKVSLTAYERFANSDDPEDQKKHLKEHIASVKAHVDNLSSKEYDKFEKSLDFVMLFIPIEPAYMTAIHYDQELWTYAYKKRVMLMSPTNLIASLKMVSDIWQRENQNKNAQEISKRGKLLYDKFVGFLNDMGDLEKALNKANSAYNLAFDKLSRGRGNLVNQAESLRKLGAGPKDDDKKRIPEKFIQEEPEDDE